jgi:hypothetical protein
MTAEEYATLLENCNFRVPQQVSELVTSTHTNVMFNEKVEERQVNNSLGAYNYFGGLFGKEEWPDGQGMDMIREFYADPYIPFTFSHFVRQSAICDPNTANECNRDRCQVPEGGRGTLPGQVFFKWGFETPRDCIANIRHIRQFRWWASKIIRSRQLVDEQVMNMFYVMAAIQTTGTKITMQGYRDTDGSLRLVGSSNPRNPLRAGLMNYMEEKFPQPNNLSLIVPLTADSLDGLARFWGQFPKGNEAAKGPRGENVYEFWYSDDWFKTEAINNPDYREMMKVTMPNKMFAGTLYAEGEREIFGSFAPRIMPWLPRFAPTADGQIVAVDSHVGVDIEVGQEFVGSLDFENAPFGMAVIPSGKQGTILSRPTLTESGAGFPIMPISGNSPWIIRNDYDKDCNKDLNQPYSQKDYEMGFRMDDPGAAISFLFRRRVFNSRPINECDLAPIFLVEPNTVDCPLTTVGCGDNKRRESDSIVAPEGATYVECTSAACGNGLSAPYHYVLKIQRKAGQPDFNSLGCACGSNVNLYIYDEDGVYDRQIQGIYKSDIQSFPEARYFIQTQVALAAGECIKGISCADTTPLAGNAIDAFDIEAGTVGFILDDSITCGVGEDVEVRYYDEDGLVLGVIDATIDSIDLDRFYYELTSANPAFAAEGVYATQASIGVSCAEDGPNSSSSSSGA